MLERDATWELREATWELREATWFLYVVNISSTDVTVTLTEAVVCGLTAFVSPAYGNVGPVAVEAAAVLAPTPVRVTLK
jgi:hypothetical protein